MWWFMLMPDAGKQRQEDPRDQLTSWLPYLASPDQKRSCPKAKTKWTVLGMTVKIIL